MALDYGKTLARSRRDRRRAGTNPSQGGKRRSIIGYRRISSPAGARSGKVSSNRRSFSVPIYKTTYDRTVPRISRKAVRKKILRQANRRRRKAGRKALSRGAVFGSRGRVKANAPKGVKQRVQTAYKTKGRSVSGSRSRGGGGGYSFSGRGGGGGGRRRGRGGGGGRGKVGNVNRATSAEKIARAATNLQYRGVLRELRSQLRENEAQGEQNLTDIRDWFSDVEQTRSQASAANVAAGEASEADLEAATQAIVRAFGGSANPGAQGIAAAGASERAAMALMGRSQQNFDTSLASVIGLQETDALRDETRFQENTEKDLRGRLADLIREKDFAYTTNLSNARTQELQNQAARQNMQIASQMAGVDFASKLANLGGQQRQNKLLDLQIDDIIRGGEDGSIPNWGSLDPGQRAQLEDRLRSQLVGQRGGFIMGPRKAYNASGGALRRLGYDPAKNPAIDRFRDSIIADILRRTQSLGSWRKYRIGPKGVPVLNSYRGSGQGWI